jgi:putative transposase
MNRNRFSEQLLREGARKLLQAAIENEVIEYIQFHKDRLDENGQRLVVRCSIRKRVS